MEGPPGEELRAFRVDRVGVGVIFVIGGGFLRVLSGRGFVSFGPTVLQSDVKERTDSRGAVGFRMAGAIRMGVFTGLYRMYRIDGIFFVLLPVGRESFAARVGRAV